MGERLIIVGASTRAAAQSAVRSGFRAWCIDQFGDRDLRDCAEHVEVVDDWPRGILEVIPRIPPGTLVITGALENSPAILAKLRERLPLAGCDVDAMRALRDPVNVQQVLQQAGLETLRVSLRPPATSPSLRWLQKPLRSAAGFNIGFHESKPRETDSQPEAGWAERSEPHQLRVPAENPARDLRRPPRSYFQEFVEGEAISGLFLSSGSDCRLVGLTRQLVGRSEAGASGFRYCGSIGPLAPNDLSSRAVDVASRTGLILAEATGCRGLFGCDFIWNRDADSLHVCEVNPRFTASAEVLEQASSAKLLALHVSACRGPLPAALHEIAADRNYHGKIICFAKRAFSASRLTSLPTEIRIADIPPDGTEIAVGHPICTVLATGESESAVQMKLLQGVAEIRRLT